MKQLPVFILAAALALAPLQAATAAPQGTLRVALTAMPNSLDMPKAAEKNATNVCWSIYDSLIWVDENGVVQPALAESWTVSEDQKTYTFQLRQGVRFHNGEPFTADAVVFSWKRASAPDMKYRDRWTVAETVEKVDDYTVKITTSEPSPLLLRIMHSDWAIVPPGYVSKVGDAEFAANPVGTGPFKFKRWAKGDRIELVANPDYWQAGFPKVENLIFRPIPESTTRLAAIQTGEIDIVTRLSNEEAMQLQSNPKVRLVEYPIDRVFYIAFNNLTTGKGQPTESPLVRQAMNYAVDIDMILEALFNGKGRPSTGLITPENLGFDKNIKPFGYDPDRARKLLAQAGYPDGFKIGFACPAGAYANFEQVCEAIQGYLQEVGIQAELQIMESGSYWDLESKKELPPLFGDSWSETAGESLMRLSGALGGMKASYSAWSDPDIDRLLDLISKTVNDTQRGAYYTELQRYMIQDPPFIYLYEPVTFEATGVNVKNYTPRASENYFLKGTSIQ